MSKDAADLSKPLRIAYIDYSNSMICEWRSRPHTSIVLRQIYPTDQKDADVNVMECMLKRIESVSPETISTIVTRIPDDFAAPQMRAQILDGLLHRQPHVRAVLKPTYGGIA